jgi:hypothetical protein
MNLDCIRQKVKERNKQKKLEQKKREQEEKDRKKLVEDIKKFFYQLPKGRYRFDTPVGEMLVVRYSNWYILSHGGPIHITFNPNYSSSYDIYDLEYTDYEDLKKIDLEDCIKQLEKELGCSE